MIFTMGKLLPAAKEERVDYGPLFGFGMPVVRIDPHTHDAPEPRETSLREIVDIVRTKVVPGNTSR